MRFSRGQLALLGLALAAGCRQDDTSYEVDATRFVEAYCESRCDRGRECAFDWFEDDESCLSDCVLDRLDHVQEPCFVHEGNVVLCRMQRLTCEELEGPLTTSPSTPCGPHWSAWDACLEEHLSE